MKQSFRTVQSRTFGVSREYALACDDWSADGDPVAIRTADIPLSELKADAQVLILNSGSASNEGGWGKAVLGTYRSLIV